MLPIRPHDVNTGPWWDLRAAFKARLAFADDLAPRLCELSESDLLIRRQRSSSRRLCLGDLDGAALFGSRQPVCAEASALCANCDLRLNKGVLSLQLVANVLSPLGASFGILGDCRSFVTAGRWG